MNGDQQITSTAASEGIDNMKDISRAISRTSFQNDIIFEKMNYTRRKSRSIASSDNGGYLDMSGKLRVVTFQDKVRVRHILHHKNYSARERESAWCTTSDYQRITEEIIKIVKLLKLGFFSPEDARGLEDWLDDDSNSNEKPQKRAIKAVLDEQYSQCLKAERSKNVTYLCYDQLKFREVYQLYSIRATEEAYSMAKKDAVEACSGAETLSTESSSKSSTIKTFSRKGTASCMTKRGTSSTNHRINPPKIIVVSPE